MSTILFENENVTIIHYEDKDYLFVKCRRPTGYRGMEHEKIVESVQRTHTNALIIDAGSLNNALAINELVDAIICEVPFFGCIIPASLPTTELVTGSNRVKTFHSMEPAVAAWKQARPELIHS